MSTRRLSKLDLTNLFAYRRPTEHEERALQELGARFAETAEEVWDLIPEGPGRTIVMRRLQEAHESARTAIFNRGLF